MKNKKKWIKRAILSFLTLGVCFMMMISSYVFGNEKDLMVYLSSLAKLPEVSEVLEISMYSGLESYYVAKVNLKNETQQYYFIKDNVVEYNIETSQILSNDQVEQTTQQIEPEGVIKHYYLGIYEETPIYEVMISSLSGEEYLILNAIDGKLMARMTL